MNGLGLGGLEQRGKEGRLWELETCCLKREWRVGMLLKLTQPKSGEDRDQEEGTRQKWKVLLVPRPQESATERLFLGFCHQHKNLYLGWGGCSQENHSICSRLGSWFLKKKLKWLSDSLSSTVGFLGGDKTNLLLKLTKPKWRHTGLSNLSRGEHAGEQNWFSVQNSSAMVSPAVPEAREDSNTDVHHENWFPGWVELGHTQERESGLVASIIPESSGLQSRMLHKWFFGFPDPQPGCSKSGGKLT